MGEFDAARIPAGLAGRALDRSSALGAERVIALFNSLEQTWW